MQALHNVLKPVIHVLQAACVISVIPLGVYLTFQVMPAP